MKFDILTIFPEILNSYFKESILKRAEKRGLIEVKIHNLRDFSGSKNEARKAQGDLISRREVDDRPFGGGPGMVMKIEPIYRAINQLKNGNYPKKNGQVKLKTRVILLSAKGEKFNQETAKRLSKYKQLIFICGRYEGIDERVAEYVAHEEISIGNYILSGGELASAVVIEAVSRLIPGVLGNKQSIKARPYPVYTRPEFFMIGRKKIKVPETLLSGNHKNIEEWRRRNTKK